VIRLWPPGHTGDLDAGDLDDSYAYPAELDRPWVRVNFVTSADGASALDGLSGGLGSPADKQVFGLLRELAEVVLVGAGTARAENYRGARRPTRGSSTYPPIAVVTGSADLDPASALLTDTHTPPIVLTTADAPAAKRERLAAAGADVVELEQLAPGPILAELDRRGLRRVLCEGGPGLHGQLLAADAVDELCLTVAPVLAGGDADRIANGPHDAQAQRMELASVLHEDGVLLLRYRRSSAGARLNE
jgi:riboflavin biosynthesis pyrimidine reductase